MRKKQTTLASFKNALGGIYSAIKTHKNLKILLIIAILVVLLGKYLNVTRYEWAIIWICITVVISLEMINSALEELIDLLHPEFHPTVGKVKDILAGAVLIASLGAAIAGLYIFSVHLFY